MTPSLLPRNIAALATETIDDTPVTVIAGARQVGKSTLMRQLLAGRDALVVNLDDSVDRATALADPDGFVRQYPAGTLAIDEVQREPGLLIAIKAALEVDRRPGRFLVTGSADLLGLRGAQESLAGRAQTIQLGGFTQGELRGMQDDFVRFAWRLPSEGRLADREGWSRREYLDIATTSSYPEIARSNVRAQARWPRNYVSRILSKDVPEAMGVVYKDRLEPLLTAIAASNATEFVPARKARELDLPVRSIPSYLQALKDVYLINVLPAWGVNLAARAVSRKKVSLADTGLAVYLAGVDADGLERDVSSSITGGIVEGFVLAELERQRAWSEIDYMLSHYRNASGYEVDVIVENRRREIVGIEVKATASLSGRSFRGLEHVRDLAGERFVAGIVLYTGTRAVRFSDRLWALPLSYLWEH